MKRTALIFAIALSASAASAGTGGFDLPKLWFPDSFTTTTPESPVEVTRSDQGQ